MSQERFHDVATRWVAARMAYMRRLGLQPGDEETQAARLERIRAARLRRRLARAR